MPNSPANGATPSGAGSSYSCRSCDAFGRRLFVFLQIQAAAGVVLAAAIHLGASALAPFPGPIDWAATLLVLIGVAGEALADAQLRGFRRAAPVGAVCDAGLWGWSRHPNYFFEWLVWCGFALFALAGVVDHPIQLLAVAAPAMMWALLVRVSGIPPLEAHMMRSRGEACSNPATPASAMLGTCGNCGARAVPVTASGTTAPARICARALATGSM